MLLEFCYSHLKMRNCREISNCYFYHIICLTDILIRIKVLRGYKVYAMKHWVSYRLDDGQKYERKIITYKTEFVCCSVLQKCLHG